MAFRAHRNKGRRPSVIRNQHTPAQQQHGLATPRMSSGAFIGKQSQPPSSAFLSRSGRTSISRLSAFGKSSQARVDPRPVNDKGFQIQCMRTVVEYLTSHGYHSPISPKMLPSGKEIRDMIEFLFGQVDTSINRLGKLEDDVPLFFKMLGYHFQISKSALYAAGSPHSWPGLLAALTWLVQLLNYVEKAKQIEEAQDEGMVASGTFEYVAASYKYFMDGDDQSYDSLDEQIRKQFDEETAVICSRNQEYLKQVEDSQTKLLLLKNEPSPLNVLDKKKSDLLSDIGKFNLIINNFTSHKQSIEKKVEERKQELEAKQAEALRITQENDLLKQQVSAQQINIVDYERMLRESQRVEEELRFARNLRAEREQESWEKEIQTSRRLKELENACLGPNSKIRSLKLVSSEGQSEHGNPFELKYNQNGETSQGMLGIDLKGVVRPQLNTLVEACDKIARERQQESAALRKELHTREDALQEKRSVNEDREEKNKKLESSYKEKKAQLEKILSSKLVEHEVWMTEMETKGEEQRKQLKEADVQLKRATAEMELLLASSEKEVQQKLAELMQEIESCMSHKEHIESRIAKLKAATDRLEKDNGVSSKRLQNVQD